MAVGGERQWEEGNTGENTIIVIIFNHFAINYSSDCSYQCCPQGGASHSDVRHNQTHYPYSYNQSSRGRLLLTCSGLSHPENCARHFPIRGVDNFLGLRGLIGELKTKELQFSSRGRVREGDMLPPTLSAEAKIFFKIQEV